MQAATLSTLAFQLTWARRAVVCTSARAPRCAPTRPAYSGASTRAAPRSARCTSSSKPARAPPAPMTKTRPAAARSNASSPVPARIFKTCAARVWTTHAASGVSDRWLLRGLPDSSRGGRMTTFKRMTEGSFQGVDGIKIFTREWQPAGKPHGVVVISHGFNAHSGQYEWVAQQFNSKGLAVYALDHRGRGRSEGERFFVKTFGDYTKDLATFIDSVKTREPGLPV